jgi:hypothetical protein
MENLRLGISLGFAARRWGAAGVQECGGMAGLAMVLFIALFAFGGQYFGWSDPQGWVQLSLVSAFIFGIICGFRVKD